MKHFVSPTCIGEPCGICWREGANIPATHKIGEEIPDDHPMFTVGEMLGPQYKGMTHNLTQYVCCEHFAMIFNPESARDWRGCNVVI